VGVTPDASIAERFNDLLQHENPRESLFQSFLEKYPEFLLTPFLLNHHVHGSALISQFRLGTTLTADFAYLTKSSIKWRLVLVEIERPNIDLFLSNNDQITPTAAFNKRIAQIHEWMSEVRRNSGPIFRALDSLRRPAEKNAIDVRYLLIVGRSAQSFKNQRYADRLLDLGGNDLQISTFDSLSRHYSSGQAEKKNILALRKGIVHFKYLHVPPSQMLAHMYPHELSLTVPQANRLRSWGYDIPAWKSGRLLSINGKKASQRD